MSMQLPSADPAQGLNPMSEGAEVLFRPFSIKGLSLPNRLVMAPMTRCFAPDGILSKDSASYYARRAAGEVGLILTEGTVINRPASRNQDDLPFFHGQTALARWQSVADAVHAAGGKIGPQLWHTGAQKSLISDWTPDAPIVTVQ